MFHPRDPDVIFAGYEDCEIYRSDNGGETWKQLSVSVRFPEVTVGPGSNPAKRLLTLAAIASDPNVLYGAIEVGGVIRSRGASEEQGNRSNGVEKEKAHDRLMCYEPQRFRSIIRERRRRRQALIRSSFIRLPLRIASLSASVSSLFSRSSSSSCLHVSASTSCG